jgi:hypothetical protein
LEPEIKEYRQGDTVRLTVELRDENGVYAGHAAAFLLVDGEPDEDPAYLEHRLELSGWPEGSSPTQAEFVLTEEVRQQSPGVYVCYAVVAENQYEAYSRHDLVPPRRFRIVEHPDDVREGPEVLSVGEFW